MKGNIILFVILIALGAIFAISQMNKGKDDSTFRSKLVEIDKEAVTEIIIEVAGDTPLNLSKEGEGWIVNDGVKDQNVQPGMVENMLTELAKIKPARVAALDDSKWSELEVAESNGTRVKIRESGKETADLYIGKFDFKQMPQQNPQQMPQGMPGQQQPQFNNYVRVAGDKKVYSVNGMLKPIFAVKAETLIAKPEISQPTGNVPINAKSE